MYKTWNNEDIIKVLNKISKKLNFPYNNIPIEISSKMTKCKGKFVFLQNKDKYIPKCFRFSAQLLSGVYEECKVEETIIHEYIHYYCIIKNQKKHGHDKYFKSICDMVGISNSTYFTDKSCENALNKDRYVYKIICSKCGKLVAQRQRKNSIDILLKKYISKCCNEKLRLY